LVFGGEAISLSTEISLKTGDCFAGKSTPALVGGARETPPRSDICTVEKNVLENNFLETRNMRLVKLLSILTGFVLFTLACTINNPTPSLPDNVPVDVLNEIPTLPLIPSQTLTPRGILQVPPVTTSVPNWVTNFSDPILIALVDRKPDFQDDFPFICINGAHFWKVCSTPKYHFPQDPLVSVTARPTLDLRPDLQKGYSLLNTGWFYIVPDSLKNPYYAHIDNGTLILKLPEGNEKKDSMVYNPHLRRENFVLSLDFQFDKTQPNATLRFQFNQSADQSVALDLSKKKTWTIQWGSRDDWQIHAGEYKYFPPERINILIIMYKTKCAVYLNHAPLDYVKDCRLGAVVQKAPQAVSFHLLAEPGRSAIVLIDNVKLWDLDKIHIVP